MQRFRSLSKGGPRTASARRRSRTRGPESGGHGASSDCSRSRAPESGGHGAASARSRISARMPTAAYRRESTQRATRGTIAQQLPLTTDQKLDMTLTEVSHDQRADGEGVRCRTRDFRQKNDKNVTFVPQMFADSHGRHVTTGKRGHAPRTASAPGEATPEIPMAHRRRYRGSGEGNAFVFQKLFVWPFV